MSSTLSIRIPVVVAAVLLVAAMGCGDAGIDGPLPNAGSPEAPDQLREAEQNLENHRVDQARDVYAEILEDDPENGQAAAGLGLTELLLLAEFGEVTDLLIDHLGAYRGVEANSLLYAEEGYLYWSSRGVRWSEDDEQYDGIRTLLADELPWHQPRLESLTAFVEGLDQPFDKALRQLVTVANALTPIDQAFEKALEDPQFVRLYVPGEVFHDSRLGLRLGRSELATLRAAMSAFKGAVYFLAAYENSWTLQEAFGQWRHDVALDDERFVEGYEPIDYTFEYLDGELFRGVNSADRLSASRTALKDAIAHLRDAIRYGVERQSSTTLQWSAVDEQTAQAVDHLLETLSRALDGPTTLPFSEPSTTIDLSGFFEDGGRVLDDDIRWFVRSQEARTDSDGEPEEPISRWSVNQEAIRAFFHEGVFEPIPEEGNTPTVELGSAGSPANVVDLLIDPYRQNVEDVYFATQ